MRNSLVLAALVMMAFATPHAQVGDVLDLTVFRPSSEPQPDSFLAEPRGSPSHVRLDASPLRLTLMATDRPSYHLDGSFVYRLRITNVGRAPFTIPWEPDWTRIGDAPGRRIVSLLLYVVIGSQPLAPGSFRLDDAVALYGSPDAPGSLKTIRANASVELNVPSRWHFPSQAAERQFLSVSALPGTFPVSAILSFTRQPVPGRSFRAVVSDSKPVMLEPPAPR